MSKKNSHTVNASHMAIPISSLSLALLFNNPSRENCMAVSEPPFKLVLLNKEFEIGIEQDQQQLNSYLLYKSSINVGYVRDIMIRLPFL